MDRDSRAAIHCLELAPTDDSSVLVRELPARSAAHLEGCRAQRVAALDDLGVLLELVPGA